MNPDFASYTDLEVRVQSVPGAHDVTVVLFDQSDREPWLQYAPAACGLSADHARSLASELLAATDHAYRLGACR